MVAVLSGTPLTVAGDEDTAVSPAPVRTESGRPALRLVHSVSGGHAAACSVPVGTAAVSRVPARRVPARRAPVRLTRREVSRTLRTTSFRNDELLWQR